jgi:hypothetical protein
MSRETFMKTADTQPKAQPAPAEAGAHRLYAHTKHTAKPKERSR